MATIFAVPDGRVAMAATLWNGAFGGTNLSVNNTVNAVSFQPDLVWSKSRNNAYNHYLQDSVRGITNGLSSNLNAAEATTSGSPTSFTSTGFNISSTDLWTSLGNTEVSWQWKAGGAAVSNAAGTITSQVSANPTAGFSVVTYTGTGANATVGHGLGVAPSLVICKDRSVAQGWITYHISSGATNYLVLNATTAATASSTAWNNTAPTSSVFSVGVNSGTGGLTDPYVAYCWAPVAGYSAFGSYTGNGSADGPFIYTGFRPRYVLIKCSSSTGSWFINDTSREPVNLMNVSLRAETADTEATGGALVMDALSNGFKMRDAGSGSNGSGLIYIYAAFAENPLKYANAR